MAVAPLAQALTLRRRAARDSARRPRSPRRCAIWARSFLLRYEPSGAVGFAYRVARARAPRRDDAAGPDGDRLRAARRGRGRRGRRRRRLPRCRRGPAAAGDRRCASARSARARAAPGVARRRLARRRRARGIAIAGLLHGRMVARSSRSNLVGWAAPARRYTLVRACARRRGDPGPTCCSAPSRWRGSSACSLPLLPGGLGARDASLVVSLAGSVGAGVGHRAGARAAARVVRWPSSWRSPSLELAALALAPRAPRAPRAVARVPTPRGPQPPRRTPRTIVVVPTYEEREALPLFVERFAATGLELLIVDDSSPDGTGELADELAAARPWMHVLHRAEKDGLGVAYRAGFAWCLERGYRRRSGRWTATSRTRPRSSPRCAAVLDERDADLVIGSRYLPGGGTAGWSRARAGAERARLPRLAAGARPARSRPLRRLQALARGASRRSTSTRCSAPATPSRSRRRSSPTSSGKRDRGGPVRLLRARRRRLEDDARVSLEGIRVTLALRRRTAAAAVRRMR